MQQYLTVRTTECAGLPERFWQYQSERFPLFAHGPLIASFAFCGISLSSAMRSWHPLPTLASLAVAFVVSFCLFLQLRIADEHKDNVEDSAHRPYRPVPRGLISLGELRLIGIGTVCLQLCAVLLFQPRLLIPLLVVWLYLALMSNEFFIRDWLRAHPVIYMFSHMLIMPLVDLFVTSCDWLSTWSAPPAGLEWFILASFFNGVVIEVGRKIRNESEEETGVETYSSLWGARRASLIWLGSVCTTGVFAFMAARVSHGYPLIELALLILLVGGAGFVTIAFCRGHGKVSSSLFEKYSAVWTLLVYLSLGGLPLLRLVLRS